MRPGVGGIIKTIIMGKKSQHAVLPTIRKKYTETSDLSVNILKTSIFLDVVEDGVTKTNIKTCISSMVRIMHLY